MDNNKKKNKSVDKDMVIDDLDLLAEIVKTSNLLDKVRDVFYKKHNLSKIQYRTLYFLHLVEEKGITLSDLSEKLGITRPATTTLIDRMEAAELAKRASIEGDRRSMKVIITHKGKQIIEEMAPESEKFNLGLSDFLSNEEKNALYKLIIKVQKELTKSINEL